MDKILFFSLAENHQYYPEFHFEDAETFVSHEPIEIEIRDIDQKRSIYCTQYSKVDDLGSGYYKASASVKTAHGNCFQVTDMYEEIEGQVKLSRSISVIHSSNRETGFASSFSVESQLPTVMDEYDFFMPGMWYGKNDIITDKAFGSRKHDHDYYARITRLALPYVQCYHPGRGTWLALQHEAPVPNTGWRETEAGWLVDESFQYASLGIRNRETAQLRYLFPGSEGERNYITEREEWARRSHPIREGVSHAYSFILKAGKAENAAIAMRDAWRFYYSQYSPEHVRANQQQVYEDGIDLLNVYCQEYNGAMGIPFWTTVPEGTVCDISFQMGFVGQQTMCAYQMMRKGCKDQNKVLIKKANSIIDFWVKRSTADSVIPRVWYNAFPDTFKTDYPTYTRTVADGMEGILACCQLMKREGTPRPDWLAFCETYASWLVSHQNEDGSWYRAYDDQGKPVHKGKFNTTNVIRFLVNMYWTTEKEIYRNSALKAGQFCLRAVTDPLHYVGGTADNDNTIDKEAGMIAVYAYLSLYEMSRKPEYLQAACLAADFSETWTYCWSFPVYPFKGNAVFDKVNFTGLSLIATGHSHADVMMGYMPFEYYKLWLYTGDEHYLEFCRFLNGNTKQTTDWSRKLGHYYPGLVEESGELALQYHNGLGRWLPWCTIALIESLTRFEEFFGKMDLEELIVSDNTTSTHLSFSSSWLSR